MIRWQIGVITRIGNERDLTNTETDSILVIEGEPFLRERLISSLVGPGFKVVAVVNYFEAIWRLGEFRPDLIIVDEDLPLLDGWETCYQLRQTFGIPVILLGDDYDGDVWLRVVQVGADFYLKMPFSSLELAARAKAIIRRYKERDALPVPANNSGLANNEDIHQSAF